MKSRTQGKRGHRRGAWFATEEPNSSDLASWSGTGEGIILVVGIYVAYAFIAGLYQIIFWRNRSDKKWEEYQGMVFCQIYNDDLRFFKTVRNTSRVLIKPPSIVRPLENLVKFQTSASVNPKLTFAFSDGLEIELYSIGDQCELSEFRKLVYSATRHVEPLLR